MDSDIKKWLANFKNSSKKRKSDDDDLIKELKYSAILVIIKLVKENNAKNSKLELFFEGLKLIFSNINKKYNNNTSKSLTIRAINSISMD